MNIDLPKHAAEKVESALADVTQLTDDPGELLRIGLLASGSCIRLACSALARRLEEQTGRKPDKTTVSLFILKLLRSLLIKGAEATWADIERKRVRR